MGLNRMKIGIRQKKVKIKRMAQGSRNSECYLKSKAVQASRQHFLVSCKEWSDVLSSHLTIVLNRHLKSLHHARVKQ